MRFTPIVSTFLSLVLLAVWLIPSFWSAENTLLLFFGRFHPLVLHLPIGTLLVLFLMETVGWLRPKLNLGAACQILLWIAALSAVPSVIAGALLALSGGYNETILERHQLLGWGTAFMSVWLLALRPWLLDKDRSLWIYRALLLVAVAALSLAGHYGGSLTHGSDYLTKYMPLPMKEALGVELAPAEQMIAEIKAQTDGAVSQEAVAFANHVQPIVEKYCYECHNESKQKGDVRLDLLDWDMVNGPDGESWHSMLDMINQGEMPPKDTSQLEDGERRLIVDWITQSLDKAAMAKAGENTGVIRRLTKAQYTNSLNELLSLPVDFGAVLPDDGKSKMGFSNNGEVLQISPLHIDYYQKIAREALDKAIVFGDRPEPIRYKVTLGDGVGEGIRGAEFGGFQTAPLQSENFYTDVLDLYGEPKSGKSIDSIRKNIGVGMRGSLNGRYGIVEDGLTLYSGLPHKYVPPRSWQGPSPNMKMVIKNDYPRTGDFVFRAEVARGLPLSTEEGLISLRKKVPAEVSDGTIVLNAKDAKLRENLVLGKDGIVAPGELPEWSSGELTLRVPKSGYYQLDLVHPYAPEDSMPAYRMSLDKLGRSEERLKLNPSLAGQTEIVTPMSLAYMKKGRYKITIGGKFFVGFRKILVSPLSEDNELAKKIAREAGENAKKYRKKNPSIRVFAGGRTDDGMDFKTFDVAKEVVGEVGDFQTYEFRGRLENLPIPMFDDTAKTQHANTMVIGLWNDHLVKKRGESGPPLVVRSIELEAPYFDVWPPKSHIDIFIASKNQDDRESYTREVLENFISRAYRRPLEPNEVDRYLAFWKGIESDYDRYEDSVKEVLVSVLCNPNFLFLAEPESSPKQGTSAEFALASKLAYFLWNSPPDDELIDLASNGRLEKELKEQIQRMIADPKIWKMIRGFTSEWLRVDRQLAMDTSMKKYPDYTRFVKEDMPEETYHFVHHILQENLSILNFIDSDFAMLNQNLAEFYGVKGVIGSDFRPVPISTDSHRGGLLAQGAFLNGHSDGVQAHPIKRAVWLKEKILGDPPAPAPPNVPELDPDTPGFDQMTLKEQLELHRNKASCVDCHLKIDPYGVAFENFDAVGRFHKERKGKSIDSVATLPDGVEVEGVRGIKEYILTSKKVEVTRSVVEHLFAYALGRDVTFVDEREIEQIVENVSESDFRFQELIEQIVLSPSFLNNHEQAKL
ncbi:MAG: DUF1592 domain-containing protein [Opitutaceae bacterium]